MANLSIRPAQTRYYLSTAPALPVIQLEAVFDHPLPGPPPVFTWKFSFEYPDFIVVPGGRRRNVRAKSHPPMLDKVGNPVRVPLTTVMCGRLTVVVETMIQGVRTTARREDILVGGTNPSEGELVAAVPVPLMRQMIRQESSAKQFSDSAGGGYTPTAINPNWSGDNLRGVGLGQLTNPPPADADIWDWRVNATHLQERFRQKRGAGASLHSSMMNSARYRLEVRALNEWRAAEGQLPVTPTLAPLSEHQRDLEGLRAYNGFGIQVSGQYLTYIHEFEPATTVLVSARRKDGDGRPLRSPTVLDVDARGNAQWVQISGPERRRRYGRNSGDPDYVAHVLAQPQ